MSHLSQPINSTGLAQTCWATTDHKDGVAVCALIDGHSGEHVDLNRCFAWTADDCYGSMVLIVYLAAALGFAALLGVAWLIHKAVL